VFFAATNPSSAQFGRVGEKTTEDVPNDLLPRVEGRNRTDLIDDGAEDSRRAHIRDAAKVAYGKLNWARKISPQGISEEALRRASLEWFKAEVHAAKFSADAIKAASEYLDREREAATP